MIAANAGQEGAIVLGKVLESKETNFGYNAFSDEYEDLVKAGVLDPTKVVRTALQNAGSIASLMLTTEALVAEIPEEKKSSEPAADTAAVEWKACTKESLQLSAVSYQLQHNLGPAQRSGAFYCFATRRSAKSRRFLSRTYVQLGDLCPVPCRNTRFLKDILLSLDICLVSAILPTAAGFSDKLLLGT